MGGVFYSPDYHVMFYDVFAHKCGYLAADRLLEMFERCAQDVEALYAVPLVVGTLDECLAVDVETLESTIPGRLGLDPPPGNRSEGTVIKPYRTSRYFADGSRLILKNKRSDFAEKRKT